MNKLWRKIHINGEEITLRNTNLKSDYISDEMMENAKREIYGDKMRSCIELTVTNIENRQAEKLIIKEYGGDEIVLCLGNHSIRADARELAKSLDICSGIFVKKGFWEKFKELFQ